MKFYKVVLTGIIMTQDEDPHPNNWDWSADKIYYRYQEMGGDGADVKITLLQDTLDTSEPGESIIDEMTREAERVTMTMHTPGPWIITGPNIRSDNHTDGTGALLFVQQNPFHNYDPDPEEQAANLRLAAAAPKLKAIVEGFLATLNAPGEDTHACSYYNENIALFNLAIETIKGLRGETE